jgi:hypothetical protein
MDRYKEPQTRTSAFASGAVCRRERRLPPFAVAAGVARDLVASTLRSWGRERQVDDAVLIAGEMFNNALAHAPSPEYVVAIDWNDGKVRLEMWDSSPYRPRMLPLDLEYEHGRGMHLIAGLSKTWGSRITASGKCVWVIL